MTLGDLYKKYPFIYEIDNAYYYIGWGICKRCNSDMALHYYSKYKDCIQYVDLKAIAEGRNLDNQQFDDLLYYFRKVLAYSDIAVKREDMPEFRQDIYKLIKQLDDIENEKLFQQLINFVSVFHLYYKRG